MIELGQKVPLGAFWCIRGLRFGRQVGLDGPLDDVVDLGTRRHDLDTSGSLADDQADDLRVVEHCSSAALQDPGDVLEPRSRGCPSAGGDLPAVAD